MAEIHHFTYGSFNPVAAFLHGFIGSFLGLVCTGRARAARTRGRSTRWLVHRRGRPSAARGIWLMHFMAMLGFDVPDSPVRYDPVLTLASLALAVLTVGIGLFIARAAAASRCRIVGRRRCFTGLGVVGHALRRHARACGSPAKSLRARPGRRLGRDRGGGGDRRALVHCRRSQGWRPSTCRRGDHGRRGVRHALHRHGGAAGRPAPTRRRAGGRDRPDSC